MGGKEKEEVVSVIINYTEQDAPLELQLDECRKGKVYVTSIDKNLEYTGEHGLNTLSIPARSVIKVVADLKAKKYKLP